MKKIILSVALAAGLFFTSNASESNYILDEQAVDQQISQATEVSFDNAVTDLNVLNGQANGTSVTMVAGSQTRGGYLLRAFFCGGIALHRYYMGTGGKSMWWFYLCVPGVGGVDALVDFCWVLFKKEALEKYKDNSKFFVWAGN